MVTCNFGGGRGLFIATTQLVEKAGRWEVSVVDVVMLLYCCSCYLNDDKDVMGCPARREEVGLCLVSMMAVRSLYCRNHSSHLRRFIYSVDLTIIHTPPPSSEPTTAPK